jgi:hypothetical protein
MALPGTIDEWAQVNPEDHLRWHHIDHPEDGILTLREGISFPEYWQLCIDKDAAAAAEAARTAAFLGDINRQEFIQHLSTDSLTQIENFVRSKINVDGVTDLASAKQCLKRIETGLVTIMKLLALVARQ